MRYRTGQVEANIMVSWSIYRWVDPAWVVDDDLSELFLIDSINRFSRSATAHIIPDPGRDIIADYPAYTKIRIYYDDGAGDVLRMVGFVSSTVLTNTGLNIEVLAGDYWLRIRNISVAYTTTLKSLILEDLIETFSPLEWDGANISIANNIAITREWRGVKLDAAIQEIASLSANESFGVDDDFKFFFKIQDLVKAPVNFSDDNILEITRENSDNRAIDKVTVYYEPISGTAAVAVQNRERSLANQNAVGTVRPIVRTAEYDHPEIDDEDVARQKALSYLNAGAPLDLIEIITAGFPDLYPGQVAPVTSIDLNIIEKEFVISEVSFNWMTGRTVVKLIENQDGIVDVLNLLKTEKTRVDLKGMAASIVPTETAVIVQPVSVKVTSVKGYLPDVLPDYFRLGEFGPGIGGENTGGKIGNAFIGWDLIVDESY